MPNAVTILVNTPETVLNGGAFGAGALIRLQSSATQAGTYANVSGTGSTPTIPVVAATESYNGYDPAGTASTWYRTRYESADAARLSDWSTSFQASTEGSGLLCSLADVKQRLGIAATDTSEDENILQFIAQVSAAIMSFTGRRFARTPVSGTQAYLYDIEWRHGRYVNTVYVPQGIAELVSVECAMLTGGAYTTVATSDWFLDPPEQDRDFGWPATRVTLSDLPTSGRLWFYPGKRVVRLTMALGWAAIPADIQALAIRAVVSNFLAKGSGATGQAIVGPTGAMTILRDISPADQAMLARYKEPLIAT